MTQKFRKIILLSSVVTLSGCYGMPKNMVYEHGISNWTNKNAENVQQVDVSHLKNWWQKFNDPSLNDLVDLALGNSPDRLIAEAKIIEARGVRRTANSFLFPQFGASANAGVQDNGVSNSSSDDYYDAKFDAAFEVDIFGKNLDKSRAANAQLKAIESNYQDVSLTLIAEVVRSYIDLRAAQKQQDIAEENLELQEKTLSLVRNLKEFGSASMLDLQRAESLVNTTRASVPEFKRLSENARFRLSILTGVEPEKLISFIIQSADIPGENLGAILMSPANVLSLRPDIIASQYNLSATTSLAKAASLEMYPNLTLSGFFGIAKSALVNTTNVWNFAAGTAVNLLDFGRIEGNIDAANARQKQAYEQYRKVVLTAVSETETALNDYINLNEKMMSLQKADESASKSAELSNLLFKEGEVSFLDVLDAQRTKNKASSDLIASRAALSESLVRLYKSLGVY